MSIFQVWRLHVPVIALLSAGCAILDMNGPAAQDGVATAHVTSPQTRTVSLSAPLAGLTEALSAGEMTDSAIEVPHGYTFHDKFSCAWTANSTSVCPTRKRAIRIYMRNITADGDLPIEAGRNGLDAVGNQLLSQWLEDYISRTGRFDVFTRDDDVIGEELHRQLAEDVDAASDHARVRRQPIRFPDLVLQIDARKSASYTYYGTYGEVVYGLSLSGSFVDPVTRLVVSHPSLREVTVASDPQRYIIVDGAWYSAFDFTDSANIVDIYRDLTEKTFREIANQFYNRYPVGAKVLALRDGRFVLDRGLEAGIQPKEVMILFQDIDGVPEPVAVVAVQPASGRSTGTVARWKSTTHAQAICQASTARTLDSRPLDLFAVSVGAAPNTRY